MIKILKAMFKQIEKNDIEFYKRNPDIYEYMLKSNIKNSVNAGHIKL